jgi:hypothetical protein
MRLAHRFGELGVVAVSDEQKKENDGAADSASIEDAVVVEPVEAVDEAKEEPVKVTDEVVVKQSRGGIFPMLLGGIVAAAIGFAAAQYSGITGWPFGTQTSEVEELTVVVDTQNSSIEALKTEIAELKRQIDELPAQSDLSAIADRQTKTETATDASIEKLDLAEQRLTDLENRPIPEVGATVEAVAAYERELTAMRQMFEAELARIEAAQKQVSEAGEETTARANSAFERASLARIEAALDSGAPFSDAIATLSDAGVAVPQSLTSVAKSGVPTLAQLQGDFPDAARAALSVSVTVDPEDGQISRFSAFLKAQLGTRSLEPREGDDPDAVLSRAEDALRKGDIALSITELDALPETALEQLANWIAQAQMRLDITTAVAALAAELNE